MPAGKIQQVQIRTLRKVGFSLKILGNVENPYVGDIYLFILKYAINNLGPNLAVLPQAYQLTSRGLYVGVMICTIIVICRVR